MLAHISILIIVLAISMFLTFLIFYIPSLSKSILNIYERKALFERIPPILLFFETAKETVYSSVYQEHIYQYTVSGYKITSDQLPELQDTYIKNVMLYIGPDVWNDIEKIKGDTDSIVYELMTYFLTKLVEDERKPLVSEYEDEEEEYINNLASNMKQ